MLLAHSMDAELICAGGTGAAAGGIRRDAAAERAPRAWHRPLRRRPGARPAGSGRDPDRVLGMARRPSLRGHGSAPRAVAAAIRDAAYPLELGARPPGHAPARPHERGTGRPHNRSPRLHAPAACDADHGLRPDPPARSLYRSPSRPPRLPALVAAAREP